MIRLSEDKNIFSLGTHRIRVYTRIIKMDPVLNYPIPPHGEWGSPRPEWRSRPNGSPRPEWRSRPNGSPRPEWRARPNESSGSIDSNQTSYSAASLDSTETRSSATSYLSSGSYRRDVSPPCYTHPDLDLDGRPTRQFTRKADVARHHKSTHDKQYLDCPKRNCSRKGANGFTRQDHLVEHLRGYHLDCSYQTDVPPLYCMHTDCLDLNGRPIRRFTRKADVARHHKSVHDKQYFDCPKRNCSRKGINGFMRQDHLVEHLRGYHFDLELPIRRRYSSDADLLPKLDLQTKLMRSDLLHVRRGNGAQDSVEATQAPPEIPHTSGPKWQKECKEEVSTCSPEDEGKGNSPALATREVLDLAPFLRPPFKSLLEKSSSNASQSNPSVVSESLSKAKEELLIDNSPEPQVDELKFDDR